jgi:predicted RNA-binding Zn-ribbon protein involved in translation (DUF1610 family)
MFFFIAGIQPRTLVLDQRPKKCPSCGRIQAVEKRTDHYLSLFFLPIIPVKKGTPYLQCPDCNVYPMTEEAKRGRQMIKHRCMSCGRTIDPEFVFCPYCGKEVRLK